MLTIKNILVPLDWSESSSCAFEVACSLARVHDAHLLVLYIVPLPTVMYGPAPENCLHHFYEELCQIKSSDLQTRVKHLVIEGDPAAEILRAARENKSDLIVMGTHGRRGLGRLLLGSVAERVVRQASCPVMTVKLPSGVPSPSPDAPGAILGGSITSAK